MVEALALGKAPAREAGKTGREEEVFTGENGETRTKLSWLAPTQNTDGSDITQALTYNLYVDGNQVSSFPGTLNPNGRYEYPLADVAALSDRGSYSLYLTAVNEDGAESDASNTITINRVKVPGAPTDFLAE